MTKRTTAMMSAIASAAGVSVPTVSKVINGKPDVPAGTRQEIERLLVRHGITSTKPRKRAGLVNLVFSDLNSPWATAILAGVEEVAWRANLGVAVAAVNGRHRKRPAGQWLDVLGDRPSDGALLVVTKMGPRYKNQLAKLGIPVVMIDLSDTPVPGVASVAATNAAGGFAATEHLISLGHSRIAVISGQPDITSNQARLAGYQSAMEKFGLPVPDGYIRTGDNQLAAGHRDTVALLNLPKPPTAIFACSDQMALGAYEALYERGLRVPDDMSVVGFDDLDQARWAVPPLTTIRQPFTDMADMATRMLLKLIAREELEATRVEVATPLVVRNSTRRR